MEVNDFIICCLAWAVQTLNGETCVVHHITQEMLEVHGDSLCGGVLLCSGKHGMDLIRGESKLLHNAHTHIYILYNMYICI